MKKMATQVAVRPGWLAAIAHDRFRLGIVNTEALGTSGQPVSVEEAFATGSRPGRVGGLHVAA